MTGGSPLPADLVARFEATFDVPVRNIFGMTECVGIVSIESAGAPRVTGSAGLPLPYTRVRAIPIEDGCPANVTRFCEVGETGQLAISGPHVNLGYLDRAANASTFIRRTAGCSPAISVISMPRAVCISPGVRKT
ncbi:MAG: hypothetical protein CPDRYMAC_6433 [uncultured Paraburkholderia sp.]|nr:MAG: hypothetical protein CPDRYDRY_6357 [uncultured Paraburkholderia sp.]CAH2944458.1 MAG: hypothetical protein CPDRYMAC_6433 [uncultured Paraburkholderia sp.]